VSINVLITQLVNAMHFNSQLSCKGPIMLWLYLLNHMTIVRLQILLTWLI